MITIRQFQFHYFPYKLMFRIWLARITYNVLYRWWVFCSLYNCLLILFNRRRFFITESRGLLLLGNLRARWETYICFFLFNYLFYIISFLVIFQLRLFILLLVLNILRYWSFDTARFLEQTLLLTFLAHFISIYFFFHFWI